MAPVYEWYQQGLALLRSGDAHAAATLLERAAAEETDKASIREALGRAYFSSKRFDEALEQFAMCVELSPASDYAYFASGLTLGRLGRLDEACGQLKLANVMRPGNTDYSSALQRHEKRRALRDRLREHRRQAG